ncbi:MAG TPA: ComEC/Rec2 family competence protein [Candidatus Acidoferrales bacterium]|nr:ComEC/Rec2 family competence protein [Candidatus Acidoferrales bacterium]
MTSQSRSIDTWQCHRPFVVVVSFYGFGLLLAEFFQPPPPALFAASFLMLLLVLAVAKWRAFLLCALLILTGWTNLVFHTAIVSPNDLRRIVGDQTEPANVRGVLVRTPQIKISQRRGEEIEHAQAQVKVSEIRTEGGPWQPADGDIVVTTPMVAPAQTGAGTNFFGGQSVEIFGMISRPPPAVAEGLFDNRAYLQTRGIFYELRTRSASDWQLREPILPRPPVTDRFLEWSHRVLALGLPEDQTLRLLWAMTLGWRTAFTGDVGDPFLRAGTMHLFAIDGLRIGLISGMLVTLLRVLQVSRGWCGAVAIPAIWFYTAATGWESSAVRASVMMTIVLGGWALKRPTDLLNSLAGAAFLILLWDPPQLFEASFQLSFFVMLTIALLLPRLNEVSDVLLQPDPLLPAGLVPKWRARLTQAVRFSARYFSLSLAAWIGSIPLSAFYFHLFSPISPLANVIAVPLGTFALMANLGALLCGTWFPFATGLFNNAAWLLMLEMGRVSEWFTKIPDSFLYVRAPSWIWIGIYYGVMVILLSPLVNTMRRKIIGATAAVLIAAAYFAGAAHWHSETELTVLPLNGGHAIFVDTDTRNNDCLIDCGSQDAVNFTVKPFLQAHGVNRLAQLVLSEGDAKNCSGAETLDYEFGIRELWTSPVHFRSPVYNKILASFDGPPSRRNDLHCGDSIGCWRVLWPDENGDSKRADDNALVLLGNFYGEKVLLLSDLSPAGQNQLLSGTNDLRADIVICGLPNQGEPLCDALADAIQPRLIVIADSEFPPTRHANAKLRERLEQRGVPVVYTSDSGAVKIVVDEAGWKWETQTNPPSPSYGAVR